MAFHRAIGAVACLIGTTRECPSVAKISEPVMGAPEPLQDIRGSNGALSEPPQDISAGNGCRLESSQNIPSDKVCRVEPSCKAVFPVGRSTMLSRWIGKEHLPHRSGGPFDTFGAASSRDPPCSSTAAESRERIPTAAADTPPQVPLDLTVINFISEVSLQWR
jgi:hypothetical protein